MPYEFKDRNGVCYRFDLTIGAFKRVRNVLDIDLYKVITPDSGILDKLADPSVFVDVIYVLLQPDISDEAFGESLGIEHLDAATKAFMDALCDFFPGARGEALRRAVKLGKIRADEAEILISRAVEQWSQSLQESSESIQIPSRSLS